MPDGTSPKESDRNAVLIVDDDPDVIWLLEEIVSERYPTTARTSAFDALEDLRHHSYGLVMTDLRMPKADGVLFLEVLEEQYPDLPRLVLTSHLEWARKVDPQLPALAPMILEKPVSSPHLLQLIELLLAGWKPPGGFLVADEARLAQLLAQVQATERTGAPPDGGEPQDSSTLG